MHNCIFGNGSLGARKIRKKRIVKMSRFEYINLYVKF